MESKNLFTDKQICIIGTGGCAREAYCCIIDIFKAKGLSVKDRVCFLDKDEKCNGQRVMDCEVIPESSFDPSKYVVVLGIGDSIIRKKVVTKYPKNTCYATLIHPTAIVSDWAEIGEGSIITARCTVTCNIKIGKYAHLNLHTCIGHDCQIGDFFTTAFAVNVSGACRIGNNVYLGTSSCVRQGIEIVDDVTVGMGGVVVKNINTSGVYAGVPVKLIKEKE